MDALLDNEETLLAETLDALVDKAVPTGVGDLLDFDDRALWHTLARTDLLGLGLPPAVGGAGSFADVAITAEALGRTLAPVPFVGVTVLAGQLLAAVGAPAETFGPILDGTRRVVVALDPSLQRIAEVSDGHAIAWEAAGADAAVALRSGRLAAFDLGGALEGLDRTRVLRRVHLDRPATLADLGGVASASIVERWHALSLVALSADTVGVMAGALRLGVAHVAAREQFGVPVGSFQAVQHLLADSFVSLQGARSLTRYAAWAADHRPPADFVRAARAAKAYCAESGRSVCEAVIQVHGGTGMTWDCPAHLYLRRALVDRLVLGDEMTHLPKLLGR